MTISRAIRLMALLIASTIIPSASEGLAQDAPSLPGGASSLQETYGNWSVACQIAEATKRCALAQRQARQDGQRVLAIELQAAQDGTANGILVLPFGLLLDAGITLQVDEQQAMAPLSFRTCLPAGCIVPLKFDQASVEALRAGTTLSLTAKASETEQDVAFSISLNGFPVALDRVRALVES